MGSILNLAGKVTSTPAARLVLAALCLTFPMTTTAHALTPQELFEKIIPKVKQPVRHRTASKPRTIQPAIVTTKAETPKAKTPKPEAPKPETPKPEAPKPETPKAETSKAETSVKAPLPKAKPEPIVADAPIAGSTAIPLPRPNPKSASIAMASETPPPDVPPVAEMSTVTDAPTVTRVPTIKVVPAGMVEASAMSAPAAKSKKTDRLKPVVDGSLASSDRIERAKQAAAVMAGAPAPPIDFQELAFTAPKLATPLAPAPVVTAPVVLVKPTLASAASGLPADLAPTPRRKPDIIPAALSAPIRPAVPEQLAACSAAMSGLKISAISLPPLQNGSCGAPDPYTVQSLDGGAVTLLPAAKTNCEMATQLAHWLDDKVQPAAVARLGGRVTGLRVADSYNCRSRDHIQGAALSEHAFMNAVDIGAFQVDGKWIDVEKKPDRTDSEQAFLDQARAGACDEFMTVLGPGSDVYHETHFHLDMRHRGKHGDSRYCH